MRTPKKAFEIWIRKRRWLFKSPHHREFEEPTGPGDVATFTYTGVTYSAVPSVVIMNENPDYLYTVSNRTSTGCTVQVEERPTTDILGFTVITMSEPTAIQNLSVVIGVIGT